MSSRIFCYKRNLFQNALNSNGITILNLIQLFEIYIGFVIFHNLNFPLLVARLGVAFSRPVTLVGLLLAILFP